MSEPTDLAEAEDYLDGSQDPSSKKVPADHSTVGKPEHPVQMELGPLGAISTELTLKSHELGWLLKSHGIGATYLSVAIQGDR